jgi:esterase FrsA
MGVHGMVRWRPGRVVSSPRTADLLAIEAQETTTAMFTYPLEPEDLFKERAGQMRGWGVPAATIAAVRAVVKDMWSETPGGWVHEWTLKAREAERAGRWLEAAVIYGAAKFPSTCTPARKAALGDQVRVYLEASKDFPCRFERHEIAVPFNGGTTKVPTHVFSPRAAQHDVDLPLVCLSGGVDTCKIELHRLSLALAIHGGFRVLAIDMPGTGESEIPLSADGERIYAGVIQHLNVANVPKAVLGISFGGYFAAKLGLTGAVDAAVDIGGPVGFHRHDHGSLHSLPNGMLGILANASGFDVFPSQEQSAALVESFSIQKPGLVDSRHRAPMLIINGDADPYIPPDDTTGFRRFPEATVWMVKGGYHCAAEHLPRIVPAMLAWLRCRLHGATAPNRLRFWGNKLLLPRMAS